MVGAATIKPPLPPTVPKRGKVAAMITSPVNTPTGRAQVSDVERFVAIRQKQLTGKPLSKEERAEAGALLSELLEVMDIENNEALRTILKLIAKDGKLTAREQGLLREGLDEIELPDNPKLAAYLKRLRAQGTATDKEIAALPQLVGKLSVAEELASYAALNSLALANGVSEDALRKWGEFVNGECINRMAFVQSTQRWGRVKRIGVIVGVIAGLGAMATVVPFAALGAVGAMAAQGGMSIGALFGMGNVAGRLNRSQLQKIASYGVRE